LSTRQQTWPAPQLSSLEQSAEVTVSSGQALAADAQLKVFMPPGAPDVQHVRLGGMQKSPPPPQDTAPLSARLIGMDMSRFGSTSDTLPGLPSLFVTVPPAPDVPGSNEPPPVVVDPPPPLVPAAVAAGLDFESPQPAASSAEAKVTNEILSKVREFFILVDSLGGVAQHPARA
jgi:hypothetical protein